MIKIELRFWLTASETTKLIAAATAWWARAETWIRWPLSQMDPLTARMSMVNLMAWQRDIARFKDEPEQLYRKRVKYALINAEDAGSKAGFIAIFERLGIGYIEIEERVDPVDWDVILLKLSEADLANNQALIERLIYKYGRTCRRYRLEIITPITLSVSALDNSVSYNYDVAGL